MISEIKQFTPELGKQTAFLGIIVLAALLVTFSVALVNLESGPEEDNLDVVATFYPFYDIGQEVGGEKASFSTLVDPGADPHSFEATPRDIERLNNADVFIVTGAEFEEWEKDLMESVDTDRVRVVDPSENIELLDAEETPDKHSDHHDESSHGEEGEEHHEEHGEEEHHEEEHHEGEEHDHGRWDPHYWLSPKNAEIITEEITEALVEEDPGNSEHYEEEKKAYLEKLENLDNDYRERLSGCEKDRILTTHPAFAYLGNEYGFSQVAVTGISHLTEPTAQELERLAEQAEEHDLKYVFHDSVVGSEVSQTIANEAGAETMVLHSIEGVEVDENYISLMRENLDNLEVAMECQQ